MRRECWDVRIALSEIAEIVDGQVFGDDSKAVAGVAPFERAGPDDITYAGESRFLKRIDETGAGAILVPRGFEAAHRHLIGVDSPQVAFARIMAHFNPPEGPPVGISPAAHIGEHFRSGDDTAIAPHAVVGDHVTLGSRVVLYPGVVIGNRVTLASDVTVFPNVTIREDCKIGNRVIIHAGTVIGSDGYGYAQDGERHVKIPQLGYVQIDDDVEIGAVNTIDRATYDRTWIKSGVKTDNLVHIGHNCVIGENTLIISQVGISGSVTVGKNVVFSGQAGVNPHLTIGDNVVVGPRGKIYTSVEADQTISGEQMPHKHWLRVQRVLHRLPELRKKVSAIEKKLEQVTEKLNLRP